MPPTGGLAASRGVAGKGGGEGGEGGSLTVCAKKRKNHHLDQLGPRLNPPPSSTRETTASHILAKPVSDFARARAEQMECN